MIVGVFIAGKCGIYGCVVAMAGGSVAGEPRYHVHIHGTDEPWSVGEPAAAAAASQA